MPYWIRPFYTKTNLELRSQRFSENSQHRKRKFEWYWVFLLKTGGSLFPLYQLKLIRSGLNLQGYHYSNVVFNTGLHIIQPYAGYAKFICFFFVLTSYRTACCPWALKLEIQILDMHLCIFTAIFRFKKSRLLLNEKLNDKQPSRSHEYKTVSNMRQSIYIFYIIIMAKTFISRMIMCDSKNIKFVIYFENNKHASIKIHDDFHGKCIKNELFQSELRK
jgi:hypothetical protein